MWNILSHKTAKTMFLKLYFSVLDNRGIPGALLGRRRALLPWRFCPDYGNP
jgi:hypothetical protein